MAGRYVPDTSPDEGNGEAAASESVTVTLFSVPNPASDIKTAFSPVGDTSRISKSPPQLCVTLRIVTVAFCTIPRNPATLMRDGYGVDAPWIGTIIEVEFVNDFVKVTAGLTVNTNVSVVVNWPSVTLIVTVDEPVASASGVSVTVRFEPLPPKIISATGKSDGLDEVALNCRFAGAISASPMVNDRGPAAEFSKML